MLEVTAAGRRWTFPPADSVTVGRDEACQVVLHDPRVSRRHIELRFDHGWVLRDLGTRNGTWRDGVSLGERRVGRQLTVRLGGKEDGLPIELTDTDGVEVGVPVASGVVLGRSQEGDVVLNDLLASRRHARVAPLAAGGYELTDLDSRNHTFVNGEAIDCKPIRDGDVITIGKSRLALRSGALYVIPDEIENGIAVSSLSYQLPGGQTLTDGVSFDLSGPSLMAVIGPSGAGKSTLLRLLSGELAPSAGSSLYQDVNVHDNQAEIRNRIGVVPQHTIAHRQLTASKALQYAAELRLSADTTAEERERRVHEVLAELGLTEHGGTRVALLSGGQQRRLSIAFELLTQPSLILLDEPTSGLDPGLVRHVMQLLRGLADTGRQIIVTTHDLAHLDLCDLVLILLPGGRVEYFGRPSDLPAHFGTANWADIFDQLNRALPPQPSLPASTAKRRRLRLGIPQSPWLQPEGPQAAEVRARTRQQALIVARRQVAILGADRPYVAFLLGLPVVLAALALTVPGGGGLAGSQDPTSPEPMRLLVILVVGAAFMGMAATVRDLVGERGVYRHESAAGLLPTAYFAAKLLVFGAAATVQSVTLVSLFLFVRSGPPEGALFGSGNVELFIAIAGTAIAGAVLGLAISALVATVEQTMPPLVIAVMAQFVLCGGLIEITGRPVLEQLSWLSPTRWGYAAAASTADVRQIVATAPADPLWQQRPAVWIGTLAMLGLLTGVMAVLGRAGISRR